MDGIGQYIDVLTQAPLAVILMTYIYLSNKNNSTFTTSIIEQQNLIIKRINDTLDEAIKIIKQQERK